MCDGLGECNGRMSGPCGRGFGRRCGWRVVVANELHERIRKLLV